MNAMLAAVTATAAAALALPAEAATSRRVQFESEGQRVVADLYLPDDYDSKRRYAAVIVGGSLTSTKEMMSGRYASELADRGLLALAIDYRNFGESDGDVRQFDDADTKTIDLSAGVTYLLSRSDVRPQGVGLLGVCTSGGNVLYAAEADRRVASVATVAGWFAEPSLASTLYDGPAGVAQRRAAGEAARATYAETGENRMIPAYHDTDQSASHVGPMEYYMDTLRGGGVPQWRNEFSVMSWPAWLDFDPVSRAANVAVPTLIVHSEKAALPDQARKVLAKLGGPKQILWLEGEHFDFYDQEPQVRAASDAVAAHFKSTLTGETRG